MRFGKKLIEMKKHTGKKRNKIIKPKGRFHKIVRSTMAKRWKAWKKNRIEAAQKMKCTEIQTRL